MSFRTNLQALRSQRNMTQEQLAMLVGVSRQSVSKWESDKAYPEMDKLLAICDLFGCTLDTWSWATSADRAPAGMMIRNRRTWLGGMMVLRIGRKPYPGARPFGRPRPFLRPWRR